DAVQALREDARERRLPGAARAGEEVGLADLAGRDRVLQRPDDRLLADDLLEVLRTVLPVEGGHGPILDAGEGVAGLERDVGTIVRPRRWKCVNRVRAGRQQR